MLQCAARGSRSPVRAKVPEGSRLSGRHRLQNADRLDAEHADRSSLLRAVLFPSRSMEGAERDPCIGQTRLPARARLWLHPGNRGALLKPKKAAMRWLLDSDPSIRWQVMRDLGGESDEAVAAERSRIAEEGWGAQLLDRQRPDGKWGDGTSEPQWASTLHTLLLLRAMGLDPTSARARTAVRIVRDKVTWGPEFGDSPFFEGEVEPCINGGTLALGSYFGEPSDRLLDRLLGEQLRDGGWNCEAERGSVRSSFHTTICVLEGLLEYEKVKGVMATVTETRARAQEYLLERRMFRRLSSGEVIDSNWTRFCFPTTWHYDVLDWTICAARASRTMSGLPRRSVSSRSDSIRTGDGHSTSRIPIQSTSTWKAAEASRV